VNNRGTKQSRQTNQSNVSTAGFEKLFATKLDTESSLPVELDSSPTSSQSKLLRPEMHMFLWPYFVIDKCADRTKPIEILDHVKVGNKQLIRRWQVRPHPDYGMPGALDCSILLALYEIAYESYLSKGLEIPDLIPIGSWRTFLKRLGITASGKSQDLVKTSLKRLVHTTCHSENSFLDKTKNLYVTEAFTLVQTVGFKGDIDGDDNEIEETFISFHPRIQSNLNARYLMIIDRSFYLSLNKDITKHLYPLLSYWFYRTREQGYWRVDYLWLAQRLGIKLCDSLWRAKRQLQPANDDLLNKGFLAKYEWDSWNIIYYPGEAYKGEQVRRQVSKVNSDAPQQLKLTLSTGPTHSDCDSLTPVLTLFASGVPMADREMRKHNLQPEQAKALCIERGIPITRSDV